MSKAVEEAKALSDQVLAENYIVEPPVDVYELAENYGLKVREEHFAPSFSHVSGFIMLENGTPRIVVNSADSDNRKKFTVAHELGHWLLHKKELSANPKVGVLFRIPLGKLNTDPLESQANAFAANLLVPSEMLKEKKKTITTQKKLAEFFGVSEEVIGYRLEHIDETPRTTRTKKKEKSA